MVNSTKIRIHYFSDILCIWAYLAQVRLDELLKNYTSQIEVSYNFISIFGNTEHRIGDGWKDKGGFDAFSKHTHNVVKAYPHIELHKDIWTTNIPKTSTTSHLFIKAIQSLISSSDIKNDVYDNSSQRTVLEEFIWKVRLAFFKELQDISQISTLMSIAEEMQLPIDKIKRVLDNGTALAALSRDLELKDEFAIEGSPTYVLNEGRQKLYGNVGYRIIEANINEILKQPVIEASWC